VRFGRWGIRYFRCAASFPVGPVPSFRRSCADVEYSAGAVKDFAKKVKLEDMHIDMREKQPAKGGAEPPPDDTAIAERGVETTRELARPAHSPGHAFAALWQDQERGCGAA
jgi:hypothetical protein